MCGHSDTMSPNSSETGSVANGMSIDGERVTVPKKVRLHCGQCSPCKTATGCDYDPVPGLRPQWYSTGQPVPDELLYAPGFPIIIAAMCNDNTDPRNGTRMTRACACDSCRERYEDETGEAAPDWTYAGPTTTPEEAP